MRRGLEVLWVEPIPEVFARLAHNIKPHPRQKALMALVTDEDGREYDFHVSSNHGASSSIFELARHRELWPHVDFSSTIRLTSVTLPTLLARASTRPATRPSSSTRRAPNSSSSGVPSRSSGACGT